MHTFKTTPGAFGYVSKCAQITPQMLEDTILALEEKSKRKTSLQNILADKDLPLQLRTALMSLHQATASFMGSDGHRKLLQREGVAYTLRYGPAFVFLLIRHQNDCAAAIHLSSLQPCRLQKLYLRNPILKVWGVSILQPADHMLPMQCSVPRFCVR